MYIYVYIHTHIYIYIHYIYLYIYILLQKENKEITRPNWRCGVRTPGPNTSEAPTFSLKTLHLSPCRSRIFSAFPVSIFVFLYLFFFCLLPSCVIYRFALGGDGNTNVRADAGRYKSLHGR